MSWTPNMLFFSENNFVYHILCLLASVSWLMWYSVEYFSFCTSWSHDQTPLTTFINCCCLNLFHSISLCTFAICSKTIIHILRCFGYVPYSSVMSPLMSIFYCTSSLCSKWVWCIMHGYMNVHKAFCSFTVFDILLQPSVHLSCVWKCIVIFCFVLRMDISVP